MGDLGFWCHFLASQCDVGWSQALSVKSGVLEKKKFQISQSGLWECDGFDVLHLSKTLKVKNIKKRRDQDLKKKKKKTQRKHFELFHV